MGGGGEGGSEQLFGKSERRVWRIREATRSGLVGMTGASRMWWMNLV